tara:strand:+ start:572 stop:778 length:207 start_codon:yes stop_codon:yes gene_type:complete
MNIRVNGEERFIQGDKNMTLHEAMKSLGYSPNKVVVELNKLIINSEEWSNKSIKEGDKLEIVSIVGGG